MGELQAWPTQPNGVLVDQNPPTSPSHPPNPQPSAIEADVWCRAEQATQEVIHRIQPTVVSEQRRIAVILFVQSLIRRFLGSEVFAFGSVPLKTYLPDGDIDLTAVTMPNCEDALASDVRSVLEIEEQNMEAEFEVKDVQYINAEVKLVKCLVQNIVVDISFNQIGGLCTLCFLEKVDCMIGKDHLFKRSIILIKAWCYYESRILGAHHGLISTYALETLVLYIFHLFHSSLNGPLAVLYRFLDYYSKFDWDNYCISLHGPVSISSLPELVAEAPENDGGDLLLSEEFLKDCLDRFSVPPRGLEGNSRIFLQKHLNIVDPLKENNNLGRSVSRANFYRIRSAFTYGARKLGRILLMSAESIADEVNLFFMNTLDRHGTGVRPDVLDVLPSCPDNSKLIDQNVTCSKASEIKLENGSEDKLTSGSQAANSHGGLCEDIHSIKISGSGMENGSTMQVGQRYSSHHLHVNGHVEEIAMLDGCFVADAPDLATKKNYGSRAARKTQKPTPLLSETGASSSGKAYHAPHLFFHPEEKRHENAFPDQTNPANPETLNNVESTGALASDDEISLYTHPDSYDTESSTSSTSRFSNNGNGASAGSIDGPAASSRDAYPSENFHRAECTSAGNEGNGPSGSSLSNKLSDLTGNYDVHSRSLCYALLCLDNLMGTVYLPVHQSSPYQYHNKNSWDHHRRRNMLSHINANGVSSGPPFSPSGSYPATPSFIPGAYGIEDLPKPRGTGTYFPNMNYRTYKDRHSHGRGRNFMGSNHLPRSRSNVRADMPQDKDLPEKGSHVPPPLMQFPVPSRNGHAKPTLSDMPRPSRPSLKGISHSTNGYAFPPEGRVEFGSLGPLSLTTLSAEPLKRVDSPSPNSQGSGPASADLMVQKPVLSSSRERSMQSYQLKDEGDFPPLTG